MDHIVTVIVSEVTDQHGRYMGFEFEIDGQTYFYAGNQWLWEGLRAGPFPCDADGEAFPRHMLYNVTRSPAAASREQSEMYQLA